MRGGAAMTRILAVDCSLRLTCAALAEGGRVLASEALDLGRRQAAELPLMVERLLRGVGWGWGDIGLLAAANGPGYFTGIRVGAAYASALAYGLGVLLVPVSSLEALALAGGMEGGTLVLVYAGRNSVYSASFDCGDPLEQGEYRGSEISAWLASHEGIPIVSDSPERAAGALGWEAERILPVRPDAAALARAAWRARDRAIPPAELRPAYCRAPTVL